MSTNIVVPPLGESISEGTLLRWIKNDGDYVQADEPVVELETDKTNVDLPAPAAGVIATARKPGDSVKIGETIGRIDAAPAPARPNGATPPRSGGTASPPKPAPAPKPAAPSAPKVNPDDLRPSVRAAVAENKLNPAAIPATGPGGNLTKEDVSAFLNKQPAAPQSSPGPEVGPMAPMSGASPAASAGERRVPMTKIRKRIAQNLLQAQQTAAILTTFNQVDCSGIIALRTKYKERFTEVHGVGLGFMSFFARAVILSLREFPTLNAFLEGDEIVYHDYVNLGIAVSTERGLAVPVLRHVEQMGFGKIESEIKRVAQAVRDGKLGLSELGAGTFTITNGGVFGSLLSTPILNPPQSGILGMHAIEKRPVAINDKVEIRPMMYVALSYDHRLVDGRESVSF
ncbi:MAG TPA: 2-oxoglutarate dehydrogenase complex dihydrolipoyllysine-residue succinyltransferase, partial [Tepidisphaeraceae bacterium]|nr:2-oxoglutarate dehydrogenase complex dihydrolipoyllysine-residue succinyltransferase [Tepidisphaeraceae bacterium]